MTDWQVRFNRARLFSHLAEPSNLGARKTRIAPDKIALTLSLDDSLLDSILYDLSMSLPQIWPCCERQQRNGLRNDLIRQPAATPTRVGVPDRCTREVAFNSTTVARLESSIDSRRIPRRRCQC